MILAGLLGKNYMSHKIGGRRVTQTLRSGVQISASGRLWVTFHRCDRALALVRGRWASLAQWKLEKDQRRNGSRKKPAPSPLQRALKQK